MPVYRYRAIDDNGDERQGRLSANDLSHLNQILQRHGLQLIYSKRMFFSRKQRLDKNAQIQFLSQLAQLMEAGVPLLQGLTDLQDTGETSQVSSFLEELALKVSTGTSLSQALESCEVGFASISIIMIRSGEETGNLDGALYQAHDAMVWQQNITSRIKKAIFYPVFSGLVLLLVSVFLLTYLVPQLVEFIQSTGYSLPWYTIWLIGLSGHVSSYGFIYLIVISLGVFLVVTAYRINEGARLRISRLLLKLVWIGPVLLNIKIARFTYFSSLMYEAGITLISAFEIGKSLSANLALERVLESVIDDIGNGQGIGESLYQAQLFPRFVSRMVSIGETTGRLDKALLLVSNHYRNEADSAISKFEQLIGPSLILVVGTLLVWVIVAVIGPIYDSVLGMGLN